MIKKFLTVISFSLVISSAAIADPFLFEKEESAKTTSPSEIANTEVKEETIKNQLDYPANVIVGFVQSCSMRMMQYMQMHPAQSQPISVKLCTCLMDQFRSDFTFEAFNKGGIKLAQTMAPEYSEVCKQLEFGKKQSM